LGIGFWIWRGFAVSGFFGFSLGNYVWWPRRFGPSGVRHRAAVSFRGYLEAPDRTVLATGSTRSTAIEAEPGAIVGEVTVTTDRIEEPSAAESQPDGQRGNADLNHETIEAHERESGNRRRPPVVCSSSKYAPSISPDRYRNSVHRRSFARPKLRTRSTADAHRYRNDRRPKLPIAAKPRPVE